MTWTGRRVLVTGAGGFIGSHLAERLVGLGAVTRALVRYNAAGSWGWLDASPYGDDLEVVTGDVTDRDTLADAVAGVEVIFHLAALIAIPYSYRAPVSYARTNVEGTAHLLQAARAVDVDRVVHTSTSEVYGTACSVPISEDHPLQGQSPYSASKIAADKMAEAFVLSYQLPVVTVRPFNTYGPRQSARAIVATIVSQCLAGKEVRLGNMSPTRDLTFVSDTVEGFVRAGEAEGVVGETVNLGTGREISVADLTQLVARLVGASVTVEHDPSRVRPEGSEVERLCADASKAAALLGWEPTVTLEEGLRRTIDWMRENLHRYRPGAYSV